MQQAMSVKSRGCEGGPGVALIMVLLVLSALAMIGAPFVISMALQDKESVNFAGAILARQSAEAARNHAVAYLQESAYGEEYQQEAEVLDEERPDTRVRKQSGSQRSPLRKAASPRRGMVIRRDRGERFDPTENLQRRRDERNPNDPNTKEVREIPEALRVSKKGASPRDVDAPDELRPGGLEPVKLPGTSALAGAAKTIVGAPPPLEFRFDDSQGVMASAAVEDEQGKINANTAPPNLLANLLGVSQLARPLGPTDKQIVLDDASTFPGDEDPQTLDGAVVLESGEAVTYRVKKGDVLGECFRHAYLSLGAKGGNLPAGTFVYTLKGWKLGYHRLWAQREGGFHPRSLTCFRSVEALREIAGWQVASLFVTRFRGEGLSGEFLRQNGIKEKTLAELGLDPYIFTGADLETDADLKADYEAARKMLRRLHVKDALVTKLREARGARIVIDLAARLEKADKVVVARIEADLTKSLASDKRRDAKIPRNYLKAALEDLAEAYQTPGLETILPEDLERMRDSVTVSSSLPAEWSEAQSLLEDLPMTGPSFTARVPRATDFNPGTIVRLRSLSEEDLVEFNEIRSAPGGEVSMGGVSFAWPPRSSLKGYDGLIQALQRHPVNINTASRRVLRAVFTGVRGGSDKQVVTPYEADQLAAFLRAKVPIRGHAQLHDLLEGAVKSRVIDADDFQPLLINAICPTSNLLRVSTTGFCYSSGDVYTVESRGIVRSPAGTEVAQARFREIVEVSPPKVLQVGLMTQADFADGTYLRDPVLAPGFPENQHQYLVSFPGARGHLVMTRPLLLHRAPLAFPGGDLSNLRLFPAETADGNKNYTSGEVMHWRETFDGLELAHGEPWALSIFTSEGDEARLPGSGIRAGVPGTGGSGSLGTVDLTMVPAGVEFWMRMRTYPEAQDEEGHMVLWDSGSEAERNRISLLYAQNSGHVLLRIRDSSLRDPSVERNRENGQYLEVRALRPLDLETWYHFRAIWDGVYGGGAQLFIDGIPAGTDNLSSELVSTIPESGQVGAISVKDASKFPREGAVRIDSELFEYTRTGNSLRIRREPPSHFVPLPQAATTTGNPLGGGKEGTEGTGTAGTAGAAAQLPAGETQIMRSPWNRRGGMASAHRPGAQVTIHGYSLEIRRKIFQRDPTGGGLDQFQVPDGDTSQIVWGRGGRLLAEPLLAFNFPTGIQRIAHHIDFGYMTMPGGLPGGPGGPGGAPSEPIPQDGGNYIVPFFDREDSRTNRPEQVIPPMALQARYTADLTGTTPRNAADYFQSKGICSAGGSEWIYRKEALPPVYLQAQRSDPEVDQAHIQTTGLFVVGPYPPGRAAPAAGGPTAARARRLPTTANLVQLSVLANGRLEGLYPASGLLELRGSPTPWEQALGRPDAAGQPAFAHHPDDAVEWLRYVEIYENLFYGRGSRFRGYPETRMSYKKQLDHPPGTPIRLVMELSEGGAGWGDYVTIATSDPKIYEPGVRRVYKVLERNDGRFFVSLMDIGPNGNDLPSSPGIYQNNYTRAMNPRLVKFPSWGLPQTGTGRSIFFGDILGGTPSTARSNPAGVRYGEDEDPTGITLDEVRKLYNKYISYDSTLGPQVRHVVVPLEGGAVQFRQGSLGQSMISGLIPAERDLSRSNPIEVFVVSVSRERTGGGRASPGGGGGRSLIFAEEAQEGLLRIGDEVFYFEDPAGEGRRSPGTAQRRVGVGTAAQGAVTVSEGGDRPLLDRNTVNTQLDVTNVGGMSGHFEREGFARIEDLFRERRHFFEIFYYRNMGGGGFTGCLRGQFGTPICERRDQEIQQTIVNVTRRLRLVGRGLLGSRRAAHGLGDPCALVPYLTVSPITGPMTDTGLPVKKTNDFSRSGGYLLLDSGQSGVPWEIAAHLGPVGEGLLARPRDERGKGILRACFGTQSRPISNQMFAHEMPYRFPDRYEPEVDSESLAYFQKSFRIPGAYWHEVEWLERPAKTLRERRVDVVVLTRFDGSPEWSEKPTNAPGGLYFFESEEKEAGKPERFTLGRMADQLELRIYFRYRSGAFTQMFRAAPGGKQEIVITDDWKETPVLDYLHMTYEKAGAVVRHEELPF